MIKNIKEFKGDIARKYNRVLVGDYPEYIMNHAHATREYLELNHIDEITILKATIIKYCEIVSELMLSRENEKKSNSKTN